MEGEKPVLQRRARAPPNPPPQNPPADPLWETDFYPVPVLGRIALSLSLSMRFPDRSPVLDKNCAPMGPEILSSTGAGAWRKSPMAFPDSSSVLDKFQSATLGICRRVLGNFLHSRKPAEEALH